MDCPRCHSENLDSSRFCATCGTPLGPDRPVQPSLTKTLTTSLPLIAKDILVAGKYRIIDEIGQGGMGIVYKAEDLKLKRPVALKFLPPHLMDLSELKERFLVEAQAAAALNHPNICTIYEVGESEERPYIAMELVEGETLRDRIRKGPIKPEDALGIAVQIAAGLGEAHRKRIVHRDIKSANIMLMTSGQAKIMDFGLAKVRGGSSLTKSQTTVGTVAYMSPEQAQGEDLDPRTDLWSLGVVLYEMLSGELPFKGDRDVSVIYSIVHAEPKSLKVRKPPVPEEMQQVIAKALKKKRDSRYGSAEEMLKDLKAYQASLQMEASGVLNLKTIVRRLRRPQVAVPTAAVLIGLAFFGVRFFKHQSQVRWARKVAIPQMEKLTEENNVWRDLIPVYALAEQVEAVIPDDPKLAEILAKCSLRVDVKTEPPGAEVFVKAYTTPAAAWTLLGTTPIEKVRMPVGIFRWKLEKAGYETVLAAASTWNVDIGAHDVIIPNTLAWRLDESGGLPEDMVRVAGAETAAGKIDDFFIDRHEVTNRQFRDFINKGGYLDRSYWKHKFVRDGREIPWEEAVKAFIDATGQRGPATWQAGDYPDGQADFPVGGISWYEAAAYAEFAGKTLPTRMHWGTARGESTTLVLIPQLGGFALLAPFSNFGGKGPVAVGSLQGITAYGAFDMAGNVREWCWNETTEGRLIRGGAWGDNTYMFDALSQAPPMDRSPQNGFRCALYPDPAKVPGPAFQAIKIGAPLDYEKMAPVPDQVFEVYRDQFSYDLTALKGLVESREESPGGWTREKVSFEAAYGGERVTAYLFLPRNAAPPYQTIVYFPGGASEWQRSSEGIEGYYEFPMFLAFLVKNGRAVLYPIYKGTFERGTNEMAAVIDLDTTSRQYAAILVQEIQDFKRSLDYLATRPDIDAEKIGYYGMSWGAALGAVIPAVEGRLKASVLVAGGIYGDYRPEAHPVNYVTRVKIPTLMLNGRYDTIFPPESSSKPMFRLLGTPAGEKRQIFYDTDHIPPTNEYIKETLAWFDKYLGPVRR